MFALLFGLALADETPTPVWLLLAAPPLAFDLVRGDDEPDAAAAEDACDVLGVPDDELEPAPVPLDGTPVVVIVGNDELLLLLFALLLLLFLNDDEEE